MRRRGPLAALLLTLLATMLPAAHPAAAASSPLVSFTAPARLAYPATEARPAGIASVVLVVSRPVLGEAQVLTWDGDVVREILHPSVRPKGTTRLRWDGMDAQGMPAPDGPYRVRLTLTDADGTTTVREVQLAHVSAPAYPTAPGSVVVFLDPGHGGDEEGATATLPDGTLVREADLDLDIALRTAAMLRAAGLRVSMSRSTPDAVNRARVDRNRDGVVDGMDEFYARMDGANNVRADLFVAIHNNWIAPGKGRTEAFFCGYGCLGAAASKALAGDILAAHVARLAPLQTADWQLTVGAPSIPEEVRNPTDDYLRFLKDGNFDAGRHFYVLGPYDASFRPRPIEMPGALVESLALTHPYELQLLATPSIRSMLAAAYYDGIAAFLADRPLGLRFDPAGAPYRPRVGVQTALRVKVTNNGTAPIPAGSRLLVGAVAAASPYDGSPSLGRQIGALTLTSALRPGRSVTVSVPVRPATAGAQTWKVDGVVGGRRTSAQRVPFLQLRVTVGR